MILGLLEYKAFYSQPFPNFILNLIYSFKRNCCNNEISSEGKTPLPVSAQVFLLTESPFYRSFVIHCISLNTYVHLYCVNMFISPLTNLFASVSSCSGKISFKSFMLSNAPFLIILISLLVHRITFC